MLNLDLSFFKVLYLEPLDLDLTIFQKVVFGFGLDLSFFKGVDLDLKVGLDLDLDWTLLDLPVIAVHITGLNPQSVSCWTFERDNIICVLRSGRLTCTWDIVDFCLTELGNYSRTSLMWTHEGRQKKCP